MLELDTRLQTVLTTVLLENMVSHFDVHLFDEPGTSSYSRQLLYPMFGQTCFVIKESNLAEGGKS